MQPPCRELLGRKGYVMESVCYAQSSICVLSVLASIATTFIVMAPFAATRLLVLTLREKTVGQQLQLA